MTNQEEHIIIKPKQKKVSTLILSLVLLSYLTYDRFQRPLHHHDSWFYWFDIGFFIFLWILVLVALLFNKQFAERAAITLTPWGFLKGKTLYPWHEIDQFGITTKYGTCWSFVFQRKVIFWNYRQDSSFISASQKITKLLSGYHDYVPSNYEVDTDKLAQLLNDWRTQHTAVPSEVLQGTFLDNKVSNKTFFFIVGLAMIVVMILVFISAHSRG